MKNIVVLNVFVFLLVNSVFGQLDPRLKPQSTRFGGSFFSEIPEVVTMEFNQHEADSLDAEDVKNDALPKISRHIATNITLENAGVWSQLPDGVRVWRTKITSKNAKAIIPLFDQLYIPDGATLHIYMPNMEEVIGALTHQNTSEVRALCPGIIHGETCVIEYYEPLKQKGKGVLSINRVSHAYQGIDPLQKSIESGSGSCEVNTICSEGNNWRDQIRSTCRILVNSLQGMGFCSGSLINNVRQDCTPYLLSAGHCTSNDSVTATEFNQWNFLFNFSASNCNGNTGPTNDVIMGCTREGFSYDQDGFYGSDFLLLKLKSYPPASFNVYYAGWDNSGTAPDSGVCIHHPAGDITKISAFTATATSTSWQGNVADTHWQVIWTSTTHGHGVTEPGSSGSPLFNPSGLVVGQLTGGTSCCTLFGCSHGVGPDSPDDFGKISFDWKSNGVTPAYQLQPWLDPDNTGATTLQGMNPPCGNPIQHDAGIQTVINPVGSICGSPDTPIVMLRNFGDDTLKKVIIDYTVDNIGGPQYLWTGLLPGGAETPVSLQPFTVTTGTHTFSVSTSSPNSVADNNTANDLFSTNFIAYPVQGGLSLEIDLDSLGSQDTWQLTHGADIIASGGPYLDIKGGRQYIYPLCLPLNCYAFTITDNQGDGMTAGNNGNYKITSTDGSVTYASLKDPSFGAQESDTFCFGSLAIHDINALSLNISPNPSSGKFNVTFSTGESKTFRIMDALGRQILQQNISDTHFLIDLSSFSKGVYIAEFESGDKKTVRKLVVE